MDIKELRYVYEIYVQSDPDELESFDRWIAEYVEAYDETVNFSYWVAKRLRCHIDDLDGLSLIQQAQLLLYDEDLPQVELREHPNYNFYYVDGHMICREDASIADLVRIKDQLLHAAKEYEAVIKAMEDGDVEATPAHKNIVMGRWNA